MRFLNFIIFIILNAPLILALDVDCPNSYCGSDPYSIKYPFKLQGQHPRVCSHYIDLTCTSQNKTVLNIPFSGDFHVVSIRYYSRSILLSDPHNCLAKRLMNLNLSSSPFAAVLYQNYTFFSCPTDNLPNMYDFQVFKCFNVSPNVTVASSDASPAVMKLYGCKEIARKKIPIESYEYGYGAFNYLELTWTGIPSCNACDDFYPQRTDESKSKVSKIVPILVSVSMVSIVVAFLVALCKRRRNERHRADARTSTGEVASTLQTTTAAAIQPRMVSADDMLSGPDGQHSYLKTMLLSTFLEGNFGSLEGHDQDTCCSICLGEYSPQDMIRCITSCSHYFHCQCIDQWFQDNSSCPVCRNSIYDV